MGRDAMFRFLGEVVDTTNNSNEFELDDEVDADSIYETTYHTYLKENPIYTINISYII
jgi:hypothetical protein